MAVSLGRGIRRVRSCGDVWLANRMLCSAMLCMLCRTVPGSVGHPTQPRPYEHLLYVGVGAFSVRVSCAGILCACMQYSRSADCSVCEHSIGHVKSSYVVPLSGHLMTSVGSCGCEELCPM